MQSNFVKRKGVRRNEFLHCGFHFTWVHRRLYRLQLCMLSMKQHLQL